jgi:hypothetical protein
MCGPGKKNLFCRVDFAKVCDALLDRISNEGGLSALSSDFFLYWSGDSDGTPAWFSTALDNVWGKP